MLEPNPGKLLKAVADSLTSSVAPSVSDPNAARQLKAIVHIVKRLQRSWDLCASIAAKDNEDIEATISRVGEMLEGSIDDDVLNRLVSHEEPRNEESWPIDGVNDPHLKAIMSRNLLLRHRLETLDGWLLSSPLTPSLANRCRAEIDSLHRRTTRRNASLVGNRPHASIGAEK
jgi:hypothetical protein